MSLLSPVYGTGSFINLCCQDRRENMYMGDFGIYTLGWLGSFVKKSLPGIIFIQSSGVITNTLWGIFKNFATNRAFSKSGESSNPTEKAIGLCVKNLDAMEAIKELSRPPESIKPNLRFPIKRFSTASTRIFWIIA